MEVIKKEGSVKVSRTLLEYGQEIAEKEKQRKLVARLMLGEATRVGINKSVTLNMGNYQSIRVGVSLEVPCYTEEAMDVFMQADEMSDKMLEHAMSNADKIRQELMGDTNDE